ncbi:MAG: UrcA family protein [Sphingomonas bacterium]|uniref:UrcA family protein n=1 Tax=Sphingomonas bacterium TaxID=1895847 RepID=UPI00261917A3|nr:UrcA family protein [Sphingomonas bacterium]MDB5673791.1 UrcA family protein [Sphingomonas bacterium]MDB5709686.1 UrcA family protein [Sphingomonas bacterium]
MLKYLIPAVLMTALLPTTATAQDAPSTVHVAYRDLNLQSAAGVKLFERRIEGAIETICPDYGSIELARQRVVAQCRAAARANVAAQREAVLAKAGRGDVQLADRTIR